MSLIKILSLTAFFLFVSEGFAQDLSWDKYDIIDGPNPTLRYGFYTEADGRIQMGRYYFIDSGSELTVRLAPYGKTATDLPVLNYDRDNGLLKLGWDRHPERECTLSKQGHLLFIGNCLENNLVMPMVIRVANEDDKQWMGVYFSISETDLSILKRAKDILLSTAPRNLQGDRVCDDDIATGSFSLYCSLYFAAIEVNGVYRHRRPSMQAFRKALEKRYPGNYVHRIRDINNNPEIANEVLIEVLDVVIRNFTLKLSRESDNK